MGMETGVSAGLTEQRGPDVWLSRSKTSVMVIVESMPIASYYDCPAPANFKRF